MSQAEFVRTMVQAGRHEFGAPEDPTESDGTIGDFPEGSSAQSGEDASTTADPRGDDLETRVLEALEANGSLSWEQLVETLSGDFEDRLESCLDGLQADDRIRYSGRNGGYTRVNR